MDFMHFSSARNLLKVNNLYRVKLYSFLVYVRLKA